jgi:hypothetical protein
LRGAPAWLLKGGVVCLTVLATVGSAVYVGGNVRNQSAPLRPALRPDAGLSAPASGPGQLNLASGLRTTSSQRVTETHES